MYAKETAKRIVEGLTGLGRSSCRRALSRVVSRRPWPSRFKDDGRIPNNPLLPFIRYRGAVSLDDADDPAAVFETLFEANGWAGSWRNGIYDYVHYHPRTHEVLGVARGRARVRFGGVKGKVMGLKAGDVVVLPAGTGHEAIFASDDLVIVGAYPPQGKYDEYEGSKKEHDKAITMIPAVAAPLKDPVYGREGPLHRLWKRKASMSRS